MHQNVTFRLKAGARAMVEGAAEAIGLSLSEFIRDAVLREAARVLLAMEAMTTGGQDEDEADQDHAGS
jgi:uncharacterized protein (DUF1778 family)